MSARIIERAVSDFCVAAIEKGDFAPVPRDHSLHKTMTQAVASLRAAGPVGIAALRSLMSHESAHVRSWASAELLASGDKSARPVLEALSLLPGLVGSGAAVALREHEAGRLRSPFGNVEA
jgi:hypothetical protein